MAASHPLEAELRTYIAKQDAAGKPRVFLCGEVHTFDTLEEVQTASGKLINLINYIIQVCPDAHLFFEGDEKIMKFHKDRCDLSSSCATRVMRYLSLRKSTIPVHHSNVTDTERTTTFSAVKNYKFIGCDDKYADEIKRAATTTTSLIVVMGLAHLGIQNEYLSELAPLLINCADDTSDGTYATMARNELFKLDGIKSKSAKEKENYDITKLALTFKDPKAHEMGSGIDMVWSAGCSPASVSKKNCAYCGIPADMLCARCKAVAYCSPTCQVADWTRHKPMCRAPSVAKVRRTRRRSRRGVYIKQ